MSHWQFKKLYHIKRVGAKENINPKKCQKNTQETKEDYFGFKPKIFVLAQIQFVSTGFLRNSLRKDEFGCGLLLHKMFNDGLHSRSHIRNRFWLLTASSFSLMGERERERVERDMTKYKDKIEKGD